MVLALEVIRFPILQLEMHNVKRFHQTEEARKKRAAKEKLQINRYRRLTSELLKNKEAKLYDDNNFNLTTELLQQNPEFYTVWNYRRDIITNHYTNTLPKEELATLFENELLFIMAKLKSFPKVYWIWNHRIWILKNHPTGANYEFELEIVNKLLTMDARNFQGWHYRRFIIERIERQTGKSRALNEFEYTTQMINKNISNFSAWHNRTKLIPLLLESKPAELFQDKLKFLGTELTMLQNAMYTDSDDQSVWLYLRWILTDELIVGDLPKETYLEILNKELAQIKELNGLEKEDNGKDNSWCLKLMIIIEDLIDVAQDGTTYQEEIKTSLSTLAENDPSRKNMFIQKLSSKP